MNEKGSLKKLYIVHFDSTYEFSNGLAFRMWTSERTSVRCLSESKAFLYVEATPEGVEEMKEKFKWIQSVKEDFPNFGFAKNE